MWKSMTWNYPLVSVEWQQQSWTSSRLTVFYQTHQSPAEPLWSWYSPSVFAPLLIITIFEFSPRFPCDHRVTCLPTCCLIKVKVPSVRCALMRFRCSGICHPIMSCTVFYIQIHTHTHTRAVWARCHQWQNYHLFKVKTGPLMNQQQIRFQRWWNGLQNWFRWSMKVGNNKDSPSGALDVPGWWNRNRQ